MADPESPSILEEIETASPAPGGSDAPAPDLTSMSSETINLLLGVNSGSRISPAGVSESDHTTSDEKKDIKEKNRQSLLFLNLQNRVAELDKEIDKLEWQKRAFQQYKKNLLEQAALLGEKIDRLVEKQKSAKGHYEGMIEAGKNSESPYVKSVSLEMDKRGKAGNEVINVECLLPGDVGSSPQHVVYRDLEAKARSPNLKDEDFYYIKGKDGEKIYFKDAFKDNPAGLQKALNDIKRQVDLRESKYHLKEKFGDENPEGVKEFEEADEKIRQRIRDGDELAIKYDKFLTELRSIRQDLHATQAQRKALDIRIQEIEEKLAEIDRQLDVKKAERQELIQQLDELRQQSNDLAEKIEDLAERQQEWFDQVEETLQDNKVRTVTESNIRFDIEEEEEEEEEPKIEEVTSTISYDVPEEEPQIEDVPEPELRPDITSTISFNIPEDMAVTQRGENYESISAAERIDGSSAPEIRENKAPVELNPTEAFNRHAPGTPDSGEAPLPAADPRKQDNSIKSTF